jgi:hypothetical protein
VVFVGAAALMEHAASIFRVIAESGYIGMATREVLFTAERGGPFSHFSPCHLSVSPGSGISFFLWHRQGSYLHTLLKF